MTTYFAVMVAIIVVGYGIAFVRKGKVSSAAMGSRKHEFHTPATPEQAFQAISGIGHPYSVDDRDLNSKILVLSSPVTFFSWGFLYPVFLQPEPGGGTKIQIGCHSKFVQMGPVVTRAHNNVLQAIQAVL